MDLSDDEELIEWEEVEYAAAVAAARIMKLSNSHDRSCVLLLVYLSTLNDCLYCAHVEAWLKREARPVHTYIGTCRPCRRRVGVRCPFAQVARAEPTRNPTPGSNPAVQCLALAPGRSIPFKKKPGTARHGTGKQAAPVNNLILPCQPTNQRSTPSHLWKQRNEPFPTQDVDHESGFCNQHSFLFFSERVSE
ncbi:hypothetical protein BKA81DRAFT_179960 [Phyllosticta paracitricarpa]